MIQVLRCKRLPHTSPHSGVFHSRLVFKVPYLAFYVCMSIVPFLKAVSLGPVYVNVVVSDCMHVNVLVYVTSQKEVL